MSAPQIQDKFNLSAWALKNQILVLYAILIIAIAGAIAYTHLGQSEDPPFTFKVMLVRATWPGASAQEMEQQVTDKIEKKLQEVPQIGYTSSFSRPGVAVIFVVIRDDTYSEKIPELWYQIRKKVGDIRHTLPQGLESLTFNDEFSDVYGSMYAITGDGYNPQQTKRIAEWVRARLLKCPDVEKVNIFGEQAQKIRIEISNAKLSSLGINPSQLAQAIQAQNTVVLAGSINTAEERIRLNVTGQFSSLDDVRNIIIRVGNQAYRLADVAEITRGFAQPPEDMIRFDGKDALLIGVSMIQGGDVIALGKSLNQAVTELKPQLPVGVRLQPVTSQPDIVQHSVNDFVRSLVEALVIVLFVSFLSLGIRTGIIVALSIPIVLAATFLGMDWLHIGLHKISLGALILALGLLVDDAIIAVEMMAAKMEQGWDRMRAATFTYTSTAMPMLSGTLITVAGFLPIATAVSSTGEYTRSIFQVSAIALCISWLAATIVIPYLGFHLLPDHHQDKAKETDFLQRLLLPIKVWFKNKTSSIIPSKTPIATKINSVSTEDMQYHTTFYTQLRSLLMFCLDHKKLVVLITAGVFLFSIFCFSKVQQQFFPDSTRLELVVDMRLTEGASINATNREVKHLETWLADWKQQHTGLDNWVAYIGNGAPRYYLPLDVQLPHYGFAQVVILTKDLQAREHLRSDLLNLFEQDFPSLQASVLRLENGPPVGFPVQFRVNGVNLKDVRFVGNQIAERMRKNHNLRNVQLSWQEPSKTIKIQIDHSKARLLGITTSDIAQALNTIYHEQTITQFREGNELIDLVIKSPTQEQSRISQLPNISLVGAHGEHIPLSQVAYISSDFEEGVIWRRNRVPSLTVKAHLNGNMQAPVVSQQVSEDIQDILQQLPVGVEVETGGAIEESAKGAASVAKGVPLFLFVVLTLLILQLRQFGNVLLVLITAPLGIIGITFALLIFDMPFGFVAMLGSIALSGMIMRNSIILVDQIEQDLSHGLNPVNAIVESTVRRFRPIMLTAAAAILAMIPLTRSVFFGPMAVAIMGGLLVATILTILFLPALYALWHKVEFHKTVS